MRICIINNESPYFLVYIGTYKLSRLVSELLKRGGIHCQCEIKIKIIRGHYTKLQMYEVNLV